MYCHYDINVKLKLINANCWSISLGLFVNLRGIIVPFESSNYAKFINSIKHYFDFLLS